MYNERLHNPGSATPAPAAVHRTSSPVSNAAGRLLADRAAAGCACGGLEFSPADIVRRRSTGWCGVAAEVVQVSRHERFEYRMRSPLHLLIAAERIAQHEGEADIEGLAPSRLRTAGRKLTFVPAGRQFRGWSDPRILSRSLYFYFDPDGPLLAPELRLREIGFEPRLHFEDAAIWETAAKLGALIDDPGPSDRLYAEALIAVLVHEIVRANRGLAPAASATTRGGLAEWQKRLVVQYIETNLAEPIPLATLAEMAQLSRFHFARAFKESFTVPPHRYHIGRRVARAKELLTNSMLSVTDVALRVGFCESGAFCAAFRRLTGHTPSAYRARLL